MKTYQKNTTTQGYKIKDSVPATTLTLNTESDGTLNNTETSSSVLSDTYKTEGAATLETPTGAPIVSTISAAEHSRRVMTSSNDTTWGTPQNWFNALDLEFGFTLDPCCEHETAKCTKHYTPAEDGLSQSWQNERVFMNPPYGREVGRWMGKAYEEARDHGALCVCFVPARVDTNWWHNYAAKGEVRFPKGRVTFAGASAPAPFPIAIVIFRSRLWIPNENTVSVNSNIQATLVDAPVETPLQTAA